MSLVKTPSYYQDDTDGKFKGIEYLNLIILCVGGFVSVGLCVILYVLGFDFFNSLWIAGAPGVFTFIWVITLRHNRPKSYDVDWVQSHFCKGWENEWASPPRHPLESDIEEDVK